MKSKFEAGKYYWCTVTVPGLPSKMGFILTEIKDNYTFADLWSHRNRIFVEGEITENGIIAKDAYGNTFHFLSHHVYYPERKGLDRFGVEK